MFSGVHHLIGVGASLGQFRTGDPSAAVVIAALTAEIAALRQAVEAQAEKVSELTEALAVRDQRIAELEKLLEDSRR